MSRCSPGPGDASRRSHPARHRVGVLVGVTVAVVAFLVGSTPAEAAAISGPPVGNLDVASAWSNVATFAGWAVDPDTSAPITVELVLDGAVVARPTASADRPDVARVFPGAGAAHGFTLSLSGMRQGSHQACLWADNVGPGANSLLACRNFVVWVDPTGNLDAASAADGQVTVSGWALDPDTAGPIDVHVSIDGGAPSTVHADRSRPDLTGSFPFWGPQHGYVATLGSLGQGNHTVCVTAVDVGPGSDAPLGCRTVLSWVLPTGNLDSATPDHDRVTFGGWALDPDTAAPIDVAIYVDGTWSTTVTANQSRPDVAATYPSWGASHGFAGSVGPLTQGGHTVCAYGVNVGAGSGSSLLACETVTIWILPGGNLDSATTSGSHVTVSGWALDPDTASPIAVDVYDGTTDLGRLTADATRTDVGASFPDWGDAHGFIGTFGGLGDGPHTICAYGINTGAGTQNPLLACRTVVVATNPVGHLDSFVRTTPTAVDLSGWALDPETSDPITVSFTANGAPAGSALASATRPDVGAALPGHGSAHGFTASLAITAAETTLCVTAVNVGAGANTSLACVDVPAWGATAPPVAMNLSVKPGYGTLTVSWDPPANDGGAAITGYTATALYTSQSVTVAPDHRTATFVELAASTTYGIAVYATNAIGTSTPSLTSGLTLASPPPQTTTPMVSTSRYLRALDGSDADLTTMYAAGKTDAARNVPGHAYVSLLDIGGQSGSGVILSATSRYLTDAQLVTAVQAYIDGYASAQNASAPVTIAVGTNNDTEVSYVSGQTWAQAVVNPLASYAARYAAVSIAGADDIEPGFRQGPIATRAWLAGYLASTAALFVNNGSADGCSASAAGSSCNNGWTMADLQWLSGGAAPAQIQVMPQIYNQTMPKQWKYISLTGVAAGGSALTFGGTLTELAACSQAGSCSSLDGATAWNALWQQLRSDGQTSPSSLPWATDLMIS